MVHIHEGILKLVKSCLTAICDSASEYEPVLLLRERENEGGINDLPLIGDEGIVGDGGTVTVNGNGTLLLRGKWETSQWAGLDHMVGSQVNTHV